MLVILEGPDGAGKSQLAARLQVELAACDPGATSTLVHRGPPTSHPLDEYEAPLYDYRPRSGEHVVCDRWHWGEVVYPRVFGRPSHMTAGVFRHVELFLRSRGALVAHVTAEPWTLVGRDRERRRRFEKADKTSGFAEEHVNAVWRGFNDVAARSELPRRRIDADGPVPDEVLRDVLVFAREQERRAARLNGFTTYVGPPRPSFLLLGDVRHRVDPVTGTRDGTYRRDPAFGPYPGTSGEFLARACDLPNVGIANACDVDDPVALWKTLDSPPVIALGVRAARRLREVGIAHGVAPHPQYYRRFFSSRLGFYADLLRRAADGRDVHDLRPPGTWYDRPATESESRSDEGGASE